MDFTVTLVIVGVQTEQSVLSTAVEMAVESKDRVSLDSELPEKALSGSPERVKLPFTERAPLTDL